MNKREIGISVAISVAVAFVAVGALTGTTYFPSYVPKENFAPIFVVVFLLSLFGMVMVVWLLKQRQ